MLTKQFWRLNRVREETGLCTRSIYEGMAANTFPKNFAISKQARAWLSDEVETWKAARLAAREAAANAAHSDHVGDLQNSHSGRGNASEERLSTNQKRPVATVTKSARAEFGVRFSRSHGVAAFEIRAVEYN